MGIFAGCSGETDDLGGEGAARTRVQGVLAQSPTGSVALLDAPLPAGFRPLSETAVRVLESGLTARSGEDGSLDLPASEGRTRLEVTTASGTYVLEVPGFSAEGGQPTGLQHFPPKLSRVEGDVQATRAVGVDEQGRYVPVSATQRAVPLPDSVDIPHTTTLAARPQAGNGAGSGYQVVQSVVGSLKQSADNSSYSEACQAMLAGQVVSDGRPVAGAVVQVEGSAKSYTTGSDGLYAFEHLAPVPSTVHVYLDGEQIGLGFAPLTSRLLTRLDIPARPTSYQAGVTLGVKNAAGVAVRSNRDIYVCDGSTLSEFTPQGGAVQPTGGPLQSAVGVAADFSGEAYVVDKTANSVVTLGGSLSVSGPISLAVDRGANVFVLSEGATGLSYFVNESSTEWSKPVLLAEDVLKQPVAVAAGPDGEIFVVDAEAAQISVLEITQNGRTLHGDPSSARSLEARLVAHWPVADPLGIAVGPNGEVYVAGASGVVVTDDRGHDPITVSQHAALGPIGVDPFGLVWVAEAEGVQSYAPTTPAVMQNPAPAPTGRSLVTGPALHSMEMSLLRSMNEYGFVGGTLAISVNGRLVLNRGYGYAEFTTDSQIQAQPDMLFRLASCSKIFTAAAALLQLQDCPLELTPDMKPFADGNLLAGAVPGYDLSTDGFADQRMSDISLLNLLQMTAGLDTPGALYSPLARTLGGDNPPATAIEILLSTFSSDRLAREPGSGFTYSDVAYMTLGRVVEAVAQSQGLGQTYGGYVQTRLLDSVGITDMQIADTNLGGTAPHEVCYYPYTGETCGQSVFTNDPEQVPATYGATYDGLSHDSTGGWIASAPDLVVMANTLAPEQTPPGFTNPLDSTGQSLFKALPLFSGANRQRYYSAGGWFLSMDDSGEVTSMSKDGGLPGTTSYVEYFRQGDDQVVYCYLLNSRAGPGPKRNSNGRLLFEAPIKEFLDSQSGRWPSGDLF